MNSNTEIIIIADSSSSMRGASADALIKGYNDFLKDQQAGRFASEKSCKLTFARFGDNCVTLFERRPLGEVEPMYEFHCRGMTALNDAILNTCKNQYVRSIKTSKAKRPDVLVFVMTDGGENQSRSTHSEVANFVKAARANLGWEFVLFGVGTYAEDYGRAVGIETTVAYVPTARGTQTSYDVVSQGIKQFRGGARGQSMGITQTSYNTAMGLKQK